MRRALVVLGMGLLACGEQGPTRSYGAHELPPEVPELEPVPVTPPPSVGTTTVPIEALSARAPQARALHAFQLERECRFVRPPIATPPNFDDLGGACFIEWVELHDGREYQQHLLSQTFDGRGRVRGQQSCDCCGCAGKAVDYDEQGRVTKVASSFRGADVATYRYDDLGIEREISIESSNGGYVDTAIAEVAPDCSSIVWKFQRSWSPSEEREPAEVRTEYFDVQGTLQRLVIERDSKRWETSFTFHPNGKVASRTSGQGGAYREEFDDAGRPTLLRSSSNETRWTWLPNGKLESKITVDRVSGREVEQLVNTWEDGRLLREWRGKMWTDFDYDSVGRLLTKTVNYDAGAASPTVTTYGHDTLGRVVRGRTPRPDYVVEERFQYCDGIESAPRR